MPIRATLKSSTIGVAVVALLALTGSHIVTAADTSRDSGGGTVAHKAGGRKVTASGAPRVATNWIGMAAAEPTLGLTKDGTVFYVAADIDNLNHVDLLRSSDGGETWEIASPDAGGTNRHPITLDPYVYVDPLTDRIFNIDLTVACSYLSFSDDLGESWTTNPLACGRPVNDHHTLFAGPPVSSPTVAYDDIVYYCWNDVASSSCTKSLDGGLTFSPTGSPAFQGLDPSKEEEGFNGVQGFCGGLHGHGVVGKDGAIYLPREYCRQPWLAISRDEGLTWTRVAVAGNGVNGLGAGGANPSVAVDAKHNLYYAWIGSDRLPYLSVSRDGGKTWSRPLMIGAPGLKEANIVTIDVGAPGKLAVAYYGSPNSPYQRCGDECPGPDVQKAVWHGYMALTIDALGNDPTFYSGTINQASDPIKRQRCGPGRCGAVFDFIDVVVGPDGIPYAAFVDGCLDICASGGADSGNEGLVGRLLGGPSLR